MATNSTAASPPENTNTAFNPLLLIELIICGILATFIFNYLDRVFGKVVAKIIRYWTWLRWGAYVDIGSLQISLLAGRIFFKSVRYHGHNVTVLVHSGYITWHYWYPRARLPKVLDTSSKPLNEKHSTKRSRPDSQISHEEKGESKGSTSRFPCRVKIHVEGVEGFFYNRSPAYDNIVNHFTQRAATKSDDGFEVKVPEKTQIAAQNPNLRNTSIEIKRSQTESNPESIDEDVKPDLPFWLRIFPIQVNCKTGALILGNENTKSIITVKFGTASGTFDAGESGPLDAFKFLFGFDINKVVIDLRPNSHYKEPQLVSGARAKNGSDDSKPVQKKKRHRFFSKPKIPFFNSGSSVKSTSSLADHTDPIDDLPADLPGAERWQGLSRYMDASYMNEHEEWAVIEYGASSTMADCPRIGFTFYWDSPGKVPLNTKSSLESPVDHINGAKAPTYGMEILVYGGTVTYGPWTDRQRIIFQNIFFPPIYADSVPGVALKSGEYRISSEFELYLSIEEDTTFRLPVREASKDWRWKGRADALSTRPDTTTPTHKKGAKLPFRKNHGPTKTATNARAPAWLDIKVPKNTTIHYTSDMIARGSGFNSNVVAEIPSLEITTSVNHGLLWRSGPTIVDCDLSVPLKFNSLRNWTFGIKNDDLELFILRDHLFLIMDVVTDWTTGPPSDFYTFTPFRYNLDVQFRNFKLFLNANDSNIINTPADFDDNNFLTLYGNDLKATVLIPLDELNPKTKEIPFDVVGDKFGLNLGLNPRNTVSTFTGPRDVVTIDTVTLKGSHVANSESSTQLTDRLTFFIDGSSLTIWAFGFLIHHLINLKENYFGEYLHFKTLEEYQAISREDRGEEVGIEEHAKASASNRSTDLDVILCINVENNKVMLPTNLYKADDCLELAFPYAGVDLRITNYYMDLQVDLSPMSLSLSEIGSSMESPRNVGNKTELFIQSATVSMHRAFGSPPTEPSYMSQCTVDVGDISGEFSEKCTQYLTRAVHALAVSAGDDENAVSLIPLAQIHDVMFLRATTQSINLWFHINHEALGINIGPSTVEFNDWARVSFSTRLKAIIPEITLSIAHQTSSGRHRQESAKTSIPTHALIRTSLTIDLMQRKLNFSEERKKQQEFIAKHDGRTNRATFLLTSETIPQKALDDPPAMNFPPIADQITMISDASSFSSLSISSHSSSTQWMGRKRTAGRPLTSKSSRESLARSIKRSKSYASLKTTVPIDDEPTQKESVSMSSRTSFPRFHSASMTFTSSLSVPYFPLMEVRLDEEDLPQGKASTDKTSTAPDLDSDPVELSEDALHTSILINLGSGVQGFIKPSAIRAVIDLLSLLPPKAPEDILDFYQGLILKQILDKRKGSERQPESIEIRMDVASIDLRVLNPFKAELSEPADGLDQFDLSMTGLTVIARDQLKSRESTENKIAVHASFERLSVTATESYRAHTISDVALILKADDFLVWLVLAEKNSGNISCQSIELEAASSKIEYLSAMIGRTTQLIDGIVAEVKMLEQEYYDRLRYLAYTLTMASEGILDPSFLTRASYLIRTSANHVRNDDSWKMVSRFRNVYRNMPTEEQVKLARECREHTFTLPADAATKTIDSWNQWRPWDITDVRETTAIQLVYPRNVSATTKLMQSNKMLEFAFRSGDIHVIIDRGPNCSEFETSLISLDFVSVGSTAPSGLMVVKHAVPSRKSTLLVDCQEMVLGLNWELLGLAESLSRMLSNVGSSTNESHVDLPSQATTEDPWLHQVQSIVKIKSTVVKLTTINLQSTLANKHMSISLIGDLSSSQSDSQLISALLHSQEAWSEFSAGSVSLLKMRAKAPNLYLSRQVPDDKSSSEVEWRLAGMSSHLSIDIDEEILDMLEIADRIIRDELAEFKQRLNGILEQIPKKPKETRGKVLQHGLPKLNLALIMEGYEINVALLQSIAYTMHGKQGRISITPKLVQPRALDMNFDVEGNQHSLISTYPGEEHIISTFDLPPVNGQIAVRRIGERISINVTSIIEKITVDAKQAYGLLTTFKRPEISNTFQTIQSDVKAIQDRLETIFPSSAVVSSMEELKKSTFVYNIHATLTGIIITTTTKVTPHGKETSTLSIGLDSVQLRAYNVMQDDGDILPLPEVSAKIRRIYAELHIRDAKGVRPCGKLGLLAIIRITRRSSKSGVKRNYKMELKAIEVHAFAETASAVVNILNELQGKIKDLDLSRERKYLQRLRQPARKSSIMMSDSVQSDFTMAASGLFHSAFSISLTDIQICWIVGNSVAPIHDHDPQDLVLSIKVIDLRSKSRSMSRLTIEDLQLQLVHPSANKRVRSPNSALLPEVMFDVAYASSEEDRRISFVARGKALDVRLESQFILPSSMVQRSISLAVKRFQEAAAAWGPVIMESGNERRNLFSDKKFSSLIVDADFKGAVVKLSSRMDPGGPAAARLKTFHGEDQPQGRFGQFASNANAVAATFQTPGLAFKIEYSDTGKESTFTSEIKVNESSNALTPSVVPLVLDISNSVKLIVENSDAQVKPETKEDTKLSQSFFSDERLLSADPQALLGSTSFNLGIRICRQEFSLSCQPIARVDATVGVDDIYITANSIKSADKDLFFAVGASFENLEASVQHVYSRESTFSFNMERLVLSAMNSKHLSGTAGISAVIKVYPMKTHINARQLQDFLLFRDIWLPEEIRKSNVRTQDPGSQEFLVQKYQQVATATAFPWTATVSIEKIEMDLDMGQAVGRASLIIDDLWANSEKDSNWQQDLCIGLHRMAVESTGRTSGFVELVDFQVRTSISWPIEEGLSHQTPLIQASAAFERLRVKAAFDYQVFAIVDIATFTFLMYNVREDGPAPRDRLVASLDGDRVQVSCTANSAAQAIALFQALEKLVQENQSAYSQSIKDIERFLKRQSVSSRPRLNQSTSFASSLKGVNEKELDAPIALHTDVVVSLREINLGAFPGSFSDNTVFLVNASNIQARFAVRMDNDGLIHSGLGMTLGQFHVALTQTAHHSAPKTIEEITVDQVIHTMRSARGGVILRVPKVVARMQTWQAPMTNHIDYIFRSSFEGKVDVGWNFARIAFLRDMWNTHSQSLASRLGKPLPKSALHIRASTDIDPTNLNVERRSSTPSLSITDQIDEDGKKTERITAVVNVPQSKYEYRALEPPIIETPQLRDMGEATPPLEWIGLQRDRLPNVTHQIVIVGLLGVAREVEDAYGRILGRSGKS